jgi:hypothetical protein
MGPEGKLASVQLTLDPAWGPPCVELLDAALPFCEPE